MHRKLTLGALALAAAAVAVPAQALAQSDKAAVEVTAKLKGANEVPGPGDEDGKGEIALRLNASKGKVCFNLSIRKLDGATAGHIHKGDDETAGPVKVTLFEEAIEGTGDYEGCVKNVETKLIEKIAAKPESFYVNIHNEEFPDGAIRGQLEPTDGDDGGDGEEALLAKLTGKAEVPGPGDDNGRGEAIISPEPAKGRICWQVSWTRIDAPTAAHIHKGDEETAGAVKVALFEETPPDDAIAEGCVRNLDESLVEKIAARPERYYVNVHNEEFPDGAIRGQLEPTE